MIEETCSEKVPSKPSNLEHSKSSKSRKGYKPAASRERTRFVEAIYSLLREASLKRVFQDTRGRAERGKDAAVERQGRTVKEYPV